MTDSGQNNTFSFQHQFHFFVYFYPEVVSYKVDNLNIKKDPEEPNGKQMCWGSYNLSVAYKKKGMQDDESCQVKCFNKSFCFDPGGDEAQIIDCNKLEYNPELKFEMKPGPWFHSIPVFRLIPYKVICTVEWTIHAGHVESNDTRLDYNMDGTSSINNLEDYKQISNCCPQCKHGVEKEKEENKNQRNQYINEEHSKIQQKDDLIAQQKSRQQKRQKLRGPDPEYYNTYHFFYKQLQKHYGNQPGFRK